MLEKDSSLKTSSIEYLLLTLSLLSTSLSPSSMVFSFLSGDIYKSIDSVTNFGKKRPFFGKRIFYLTIKDLHDKRRENDNTQGA
jgi:hypothetical protein